MVKKHVFYDPDSDGSNPATSNFLQIKFFLYLLHTVSFPIRFFSKFIDASIAQWLKHVSYDQTRWIESRHFQFHPNIFFLCLQHTISFPITFFKQVQLRVDSRMAKNAFWWLWPRGFESRHFQFHPNRFFSVPITYYIIPHNFFSKFMSKFM